MNEVLDAAGLSLGISAASVAVSAAAALPLAVALGLSRSRVAEAVLFLARLGMAVPTVVVGLVVYGLLSRHGPLGPMGLLYTPQAIVLGEVMLGFPMVVALGAAAVRGLDPRFFDALRTMRAGRTATAWLAIREARDGFLVAVVAAFARCVTELGVALLVGGSLKGTTRTLTAAIALETSRGDFERGLALGGVLLAVALLVNGVLAFGFREARS